MKLSEMLSPDRILIHFKARDKNEALKVLVEKVDAGLDKDKVFSSLLERENLGSTGIGERVAVPHVKLDAIDDVIIVFGLAHKPVNFEAIDGEPCSFFFLVLGPASEENQDKYLKAMAKVSRLMRDEGFRSELLNVKSPEETLELIQK